MLKRLFWGFVLPFCLFIFQGCQCSSSPETYNTPDFPTEPVTTNATSTTSISPSVGTKSIRYFNYEGKPVQASNSRGAYYYRLAYYINGKPNPDSLAIDYFLSGEKKAEGYVLSENPDVFDGERITYHKNGSVESKQTFINGVPASNRTAFSSDGRLYSLTEYENGIQVKHTSYEWYQEIHYHPNGIIKSRITFEDPGQNSFIGEDFFESGRLKSKARFVKAPDFNTSHSYKTVGDVYLYDENGHQTIKNNDPKPITPRTSSTSNRRQRGSNWDRGYSYGWSTGYQDAVDGNDKWYSYNESGKGGDFLDGYTSGYEDGYENGERERRDNNDDEDDDDYY